MIRLADCFTIAETHPIALLVLIYVGPNAVFWHQRISRAHFQTRCRKRQIHQALSALFYAGFLSVFGILFCMFLPPSCSGLVSSTNAIDLLETLVSEVTHLTC